MKHIADKPHQTGAGRILNFVQQDRQSGLHPAIQALHARPVANARDATRRVAEYARIERGHRA